MKLSRADRGFLRAQMTTKTTDEDVKDRIVVETKEIDTRPLLKRIDELEEAVKKLTKMFEDRPTSARLMYDARGRAVGIRVE